MRDEDDTKDHVYATAGTVGLLEIEVRFANPISRRRAEVKAEREDWFQPPVLPWRGGLYTSGPSSSYLSKCK
jgi:hypothetical protein